MLASDFLGAVATGIEGYAGGVTDRETVRLKKAEAEDKMADIETKQELGVTREEYETVVAEQDRLQKTLARRNTFDSFRAYTADFDVRHLNDAIRNDPTLKNLAGDMANIAKIDVVNDIGLMKQEGLDPIIFEDENARNRYLKMTNTDGSTEILDMAAAYVGTGYAASLDKAALDDLLTKSQIAKNLAKGETPTAAEKESKRLGEIRQKPEDQRTEEEKAFVQMMEKKIAGVKPGQLSLVDEETKKLEDSFGGEEAFFKTDFSKQKNRLKAHPRIAKIEALEGTEFSTKEKNDINDIRVLISLGNPAEKLTAEQTGLIDNTFFNVKKYFTDEGLDIGATSAYAAFRNTVRHTLFGSALTEHEIKSFNEAFGTLKQKLGPVLEQFKTGLNQVKAKLESIASFKNPHSAKYRLGKSQEEIEGIIGKIDQRIRFLEGKTDVELKAPVAPTVDPKTKAIMDGLLKGANK